MSANPFKPAVRQAQKARILITGPDGAGKTYTACELAHTLGEKIAVVDTEFDRAKLCVDEVGPFDHVTLTRHEPKHYVEMIEAAAANGYDVVILDSLTHAWKAVLAAVDATTNSNGKQDGRQGWRNQRPEHDALIRAIVQAPIHVIATARSKKEIDWEDDKKRSIGMVPIADSEVRFEFDLVLDMDREHTGTVSKVRGCSFMDGRTERRPKRAFLVEFKKWLDSGAVNTDALARELIALAGDKDALAEELAKAKIGRADLADDAVMAKARKLAEKIRDRKPEPPPAEPQATRTEVISEEQRRRMLAIGADAGLSKDDVKDVVAQMTGADSTTRVPLDQYDEVCTYLEELVPAAAGGAS